MSYLHSIPKSMGYAWSGMKAAVKNEPNFRIHVIIALLAIGLGIFVGLNSQEWAVLVLTVAVVVVLELVNTAMEAIVNLVSPQMQEAARIAKDTSAAAVLISAVGAILVAIFLFLPKLLK